MIIIPMGLFVFIALHTFHSWEPQGTKCYWQPLQKQRAAASVWDISQAAPSSMCEGYCWSDNPALKRELGSSPVSFTGTHAAAGYARWVLCWVLQPHGSGLRWRELHLHWAFPLKYTLVPWSHSGGKSWNVPASTSTDLILTAAAIYKTIRLVKLEESSESWVVLNSGCLLESPEEILKTLDAGQPWFWYSDLIELEQGSGSWCFADYLQDWEPLTSGVEPCLHSSFR